MTGLLLVLESQGHRVFQAKRASEVAPHNSSHTSASEFDRYFIWSWGPTGVGKSGVERHFASPEELDVSNGDAATVLIDELVQKHPVYKRAAAAVLFSMNQDLGALLVSAGVCGSDGSFIFNEEDLQKATRDGASYLLKFNRWRVVGPEEPEDTEEKLKEQLAAWPTDHNMYKPEMIDVLTSSSLSPGVGGVIRLLTFAPPMLSPTDMLIVVLAWNKIYDYYIQTMKSSPSTLATLRPPELTAHGVKTLQVATQLQSLYSSVRFSNAFTLEPFLDNYVLPHMVKRRLVVMESVGDKLGSALGWTLHVPDLADEIEVKTKRIVAVVWAKYTDVLQRNLGRANQKLLGFFNKMMEDGVTDVCDSATTDTLNYPAPRLPLDVIQESFNVGRRKAGSGALPFYNKFVKIQQNLKKLTERCLVLNATDQGVQPICIPNHFDEIQIFANQNEDVGHLRKLAAFKPGVDIKQAEQRMDKIFEEETGLDLAGRHLTQFGEAASVIPMKRRNAL